jgi:23S rRNA pseudouridine1911/1915/1917 synthase
MTADQGDSPDDEDLLETLRFDVAAGEEDRLDRFLVAKLDALDDARRAGLASGATLLASRALVQRWIDDGRVRIGLRPLKKGIKVRAGEVVLVDVPPPAPAAGPLVAEAIPLRVLHEDDDLVVIDKPPGLTVHPGAGQRTGTLANALLALTSGRVSTLGGDDRPGIVHRLDKDTSGLIVCARTDRAHRFLSQQFHDRLVDKRYWALVEGAPAEEQGTIDAPIGRSLRDRKKMAIRRDGDGRRAVTHWRVLERFQAPEPRALVELKIETGRTHQIRVHLASIHHPVVADDTYGRSAVLADETGAPLIARQALHARSLRFARPDGGELAFEASLPDDFTRALEWLRRTHKIRRSTT